ncbi:hypothetical protein ACM44_14800 [Chryseobacterium koreense CCUG 49689]|uniref:Uncharacterized protein n=3 Tax=Chryseobacterium koreense TaxID=232216 RepID=A0A0J7LEC4_9FLAO|nr:hypothetical protein ACM44_14800 [Chryseobacterium koreense CCUG 49689]
MTFGFLQNSKMAEIFVKSGNINEVETQFRIENFGGIELNNFVLTSHFMGLFGILISICICFSILRKVPKKWIFIVIIFLTNIFILYHKKFAKPSQWLDFNPLNVGIVPNIFLTGFFLIFIALILFYVSKKTLKFTRE